MSMIITDKMLKEHIEACSASCGPIAALSKGIAESLQLLRRRKEALRDVHKVQVNEPSSQQERYMQGLANGLIMAMAMLDGVDPKFIRMPSEINQATSKALPVEDLDQDAATGSAMSEVIPTCKQIDQALKEMHEGGGE